MLLTLPQFTHRWEFTPRHIRDMELHVLHVVDWRVNFVTPYSFIDRLLVAVGARSPLDLQQLRMRASCLVRNAVYDASFLEFSPSALAAAALICVFEEEDCQSELAALGICASSAYSVLQRSTISPNQVSSCQRMMEDLIINSLSYDSSPARVTPNSVLSFPAKRSMRSR